MRRKTTTTYSMRSRSSTREITVGGVHIFKAIYEFMDFTFFISEFYGNWIISYKYKGDKKFSCFFHHFHENIRLNPLYNVFQRFNNFTMQFPYALSTISGWVVATRPRTQEWNARLRVVHSIHVLVSSNSLIIDALAVVNKSVVRSKLFNKRLHNNKMLYCIIQYLYSNWIIPVVAN